jgi:hypothetical protein
LENDQAPPPAVLLLLLLTGATCILYVICELKHSCPLGGSSLVVSSTGCGRFAVPLLPVPVAGVLGVTPDAVSL